MSGSHSFEPVPYSSQNPDSSSSAPDYTQRPSRQSNPQARRQNTDPRSSRYSSQDPSQPYTPPNPYEQAYPDSRTARYQPQQQQQHHSPSVPRHYANLRQQYETAAQYQGEEEESQHNRRDSSDIGPTDPAPGQLQRQSTEPKTARFSTAAPTTYPPIAFHQSSVYDPDQQQQQQRYGQASATTAATTDDPSSSRRASDVPIQRPARTNSQRQTAQYELKRLSTASTAAGRPSGDESPTGTRRPSQQAQGQAAPQQTQQQLQPVQPPVADPKDEPITIEVFRALIGIPQKGSGPLPLDSARRAAAGDEPITPKTPYSGLSQTQVFPQVISDPAQVKRPRSWLRFFISIATFGLRQEERDDELATSVYYSLMTQEKMNRRWYFIYDAVTYTCMVLQLIIASALIILGALNGDRHIVVAVLGAVTGVLTGILSLIKGQGFPARLINYIDALRKVREDIEFTERELRAGRKIVTYGQVVALRDAYEQVRADESKNRPDNWTTGTTPSSGSQTAAKSSQKSQVPGNIV